MALDLSFSENYWEDLERCLVDPNFDKVLIKKGFDFMSEAHKGQTRYSGKPYISHPVWIAKIISQLNIGQERCWLLYFMIV